MNCKSCLVSEQGGLTSSGCPLNLSLGLPEFIAKNYRHNNCKKLIKCLDIESMTYHDTPGENSVKALIKLYKRINPEFRKWYNIKKDDLNILLTNGSIQLHLLSIMTFYNLAGKPSKFKIYMKAPYFFESKVLIDNLPGVEFTDNVNDADMEILVSPNNPNNVIQTPSISPGKFLLIDGAYNNPNFVNKPFWYSDFSNNYRTVIISTASKIFGMAAERVGWAFITDQEIYNGLLQNLFSTTTGYNGYSICLVRDAMFNYNKDNIIYQTLKCRHKQLIKLLEVYQIKVLSPVGAYAWLAAEFNLTEFFLSKGIIVNPGSNFGTNDMNCRLNIMASECSWQKFIEILT